MDWIHTIVFAPGLPVIMSLAAKASVVVLVALATVYITRSASASTRCFLISTVLLVLPILPVLTTLAPSWELPLPDVVRSRLVRAEIVTPAAQEAHTAPGATPTMEPEPKSSREPTGATSMPYNLLFYLWLAGTIAVSGRVVLGVVLTSTARRRRSDVVGPVPVRLERMAANASRIIGLRRHVSVILKTDVSVPQAHGILRPIVVLPVQAATWSNHRLTAVMLHELAHIKRNDHIVRPLANAAASWLWFNPLIWLALARMRRESEKACDDFVLGAGTTGISYAEHLYVLCRNLRSSIKPASAAAMLIRKNELEERVMHMLSTRADRRPMNLKKRLVVTMLVALTALPVVGVSGFKADPVLTDVSQDERNGIMTTLAEFYLELSNGSDYESVRERFLTSDYFDDPDLTLENLTDAVKRAAFDNTISLLTESAVSPAREIRGRVMSVHREGNEYVATQHLNVIAQRFVGAVKYEDEDGNIVTRPDPASKGEKKVDECNLVNALGHQIRFRMEDGMWKISQFDDGVALMRMDTDNPYGPIFLFWMEDIDAQTTPFGPGIMKVIPLDIVPSASNAKFVLENR